MAEFQIPREFSDAKDLLKDKEIDAVSIALPNDLHAPIARSYLLQLLFFAGPLLLIHAYEAWRDDLLAVLKLRPALRYALCAIVLYLTVLWGDSWHQSPEPRVGTGAVDGGVIMVAYDYGAGWRWAADVGERKPDRRTEHSFLPLENSVFLVHRPEQFLMGSNVLRRTKKQIAAGPECVMKERDDAALQIRSEIDHDVPAGDQIQTRKRWVFDETMG